MPIFRADHVGSLLRPAELLAAREDFAAGRVTLETLRAAEDRAIAAALQRQRDIGLDVLSDGEMRRGSWVTDMAEAVDGFTEQRVPLEWRGPGGAVETSTAQAVGAKLRKTRYLTQYETPFLAAQAGAPFKVTLPAPSNFIFSSFKPGVTDRVYPTRAALLDEMVEIIRDEIRWLIGSGVPYVQLDAPFYSHYLDDRERVRFRSAGEDPDAALALAIAGDNAALSGMPRVNTTYALHVCRGNNRSRWYTEGAYDAIAERLFGTLDVDAFLLEYDDERSGGFEPLARVPLGKRIVLGLITTKRAALESMDDLRRQIDRAARFVPLDYLALSPQCGFASIARGNLLGIDDQWRKLELVVETARKIWGG